MSTDYRTRDLTEDVTFEDLVKELDAILDSWLFEDVSPVLDEARLACVSLEAA